MACVHVSCGPSGRAAHAAPRSSPVFAGSRSSSMSGAAGGVSHGSVVSVVGNVPSCVPGGMDASREDLQIGVDDAGLYVVLIKQLLHCVLIKQLLIARAVSKRAPIKPWRATQAKILRVRLASLAASSILHVGLMRSSLSPRVMCGIRDSSHKHMHTQNTHTHTHARTHTHTYTQIHTHTHTHTRGQILCVCGYELSLTHTISLSISLSLGVPACVSGGGDALLAGAEENSWQSRPRHACASSAFHTPSSQQPPCTLPGVQRQFWHKLARPPPARMAIFAVLTT